jgi:hypothetical protein
MHTLHVPYSNTCGTYECAWSHMNHEPWLACQMSGLTWAMSAYVTPSYLEGTESHYTLFLMGTLGHSALSACLAINMAYICLAVCPSILGVLSCDHQITCLNLHCTPTPWQGLVIVVVVGSLNLCYPSCLEGDWHRCLICCCHVAPPTQGTRLQGAPTIVPHCP